MCGIVAVVRRPPAGAPPELTPLLEQLDAVEAALAAPGADRAAALIAVQNGTDNLRVCLFVAAGQIAKRRRLNRKMIRRKR